jgi:hypothetical protein
MTEAMGIIIGAIVGAVFGTISALIGARLTYQAAERKRADDLFSTALELMGGGTQRRNLGIAAITLYWREFPQHKQLCAEMLIGSAIYLLTESQQEDASHEVFNLHRIMALLKDIAPDLKDHEGYKRLKKVVDERTASHDRQPKPKRGVWVDKSALATWQNDLKEVTE